MFLIDSLYTHFLTKPIKKKIKEVKSEKMDSKKLLDGIGSEMKFEKHIRSASRAASQKVES